MKKRGDKYQKKFFFTDDEINLVEEYRIKKDIPGSFQNVVKTALFKEIHLSILEELTKEDSELANKIKHSKSAKELVDIVHDMGISRHDRMEIRRGLEKLEEWEERIGKY